MLQLTAWWFTLLTVFSLDDGSILAASTTMTTGCSVFCEGFFKKIKRTNPLITIFRLWLVLYTLQLQHYLNKIQQVELWRLYIAYVNPANIIHQTDVALMLGHRLGRQPNNKTTLGQRLVFAGNAITDKIYLVLH